MTATLLLHNTFEGTAYTPHQFKPILYHSHSFQSTSLPSLKLLDVSSYLHKPLVRIHEITYNMSAYSSVGNTVGDNDVIQMVVDGGTGLQ